MRGRVENVDVLGWNKSYIQINIFKVNPHRDMNIVIPNLCALSKQNLSQIIHQHFGHVSITRLKPMARKGLMKCLPENIPDLEEPCPVCLLTNATKFIRGPTTDVSKLPLGSCFRWILRF